jgi:hypothetical protein
MYSW